jgi:5-methyltetrahydropteroyltriglutamate--homocysteine methyltransferase
MSHTAETAARTPARAEAVGSLLRPVAMKDVFEKAYGPHLHVDVFSQDQAEAVRELHRLAASLTPEIVRRQIDAGLDVVTDGELTRGFFANSLIDSVGGIEFDSEIWGDHGDPVPVVKQPLFKRDNPALREAKELIAATSFPKKVTFPAASFFFLGHVIRIGSGVYEEREAFVDDVIAIQRQLVDEVIEAGVEHVQFDFPVYPMLVDGSWHERIAAQGETPESLLDKALAADAKMVGGLPSHVTTALHLCRGNQIRFFSGSLEPIAERVFGLPYDRFLVEWHDVVEDGPYDPIRFVAAPKVLVLGLISTKTPDVEAEDDIVRRIESAAQLLDLSQLAISPQCGFASTWQGHKYSEDIQWRKLELAGRVAQRLWS